MRYRIYNPQWRNKSTPDGSDTVNGVTLYHHNWNISPVNSAFGVSVTARGAIASYLITVYEFGTYKIRIRDYSDIISYIAIVKVTGY